MHIEKEILTAGKMIGLSFGGGAVDLKHPDSAHRTFLTLGPRDTPPSSCSGIYGLHEQLRFQYPKI